MSIRSVDLTFRNRSYRIREPEREAGASVRMGDYTVCAGCFKTLRPEARRVVDGRKLSPHCIVCALTVGLLVETPESIARCESDRAVGRDAQAGVR